MVRSIDKLIQTSLKVKCLQEECSDWTGCIKDYKVCRNIHIFYTISYRFHAKIT